MLELFSGYWVEALGLSLLHFLWQGVLVAGVVWSLDLWLRRSDPRTRYTLALGGLLAMVLLPVGTFLFLVASHAPADATGAAATMAVTAVSAGSEAASSPGWITWVVSAWALGVLIYAARLITGLTRLARIRRTAEPAPEWLVQQFHALITAFGVSERTQLKVSEQIHAPLMLGWLRPLVLVPPAVIAGFPPHQLQMILAHELAHVRRHDYLINLLQLAAETLLFYHPAVHWLSNHIRALREQCCDDLAVRMVEDRYGYARTLAELEDMRRFTPALSLGMAEGQILTRIRRLVEPGRGRQRGFTAMTVTLLSTALLLSALVLSYSINGNGKNGDGEDADNNEEASTAADVAPRLDISHTQVETALAMADDPTSDRQVSDDQDGGEETSASDSESGSAGESPEDEDFLDPELHVDNGDEQALEGRAAELQREAEAAELADQIVAEDTPAEERDPGRNVEIDPQAWSEALAVSHEETIADRNSLDTVETGREAMREMTQGIRPDREGETELESASGEPDRPVIQEELVTPEFPRKAASAGESGTVVVEFTVTEDGNVRDARVVDNDNPGHGFEAAAIEAMEASRFEPRIVDGRPTADTVRRTIEFDLEKTEGCRPQTGSRMNRC